MTGSHSRPLDRSAAAPRSQGRDTIGRGQFAIWLPWLAAPVFLLLPVAGCGAAAALRQRALAAGGQIQAAAVQMQAAAVQVPAAAVQVQAGGAAGRTGRDGHAGRPGHPHPAPRLTMAVAAFAN